MSVGTFIFSKEHMWASVDGDKAFEVHTPLELSKNVTWLTNLSLSEIRGVQFAKDVKVYPSTFLGLSFLTILEEWGFSTAEDDVRAAFLSLLFARLHSESSRYIKRRKKVFASGLTHLLPDPVFHDGRVGEALSEATNSWWAVGHEASYKDQHIITFHMPRASYNAGLMLSDVPDDLWRWVKLSSIGTDQQGVCDKLKAMTDPFFVTFSEYQTRGSLMSFYPDNVLAKSLSGSPKDRGVMSSLEYQLIADQIDLEITGIFVAGGWTSSPLVSDMTSSSLLKSYNTPVAQNSWTVGLLLENFRCAYTSRQSGYEPVRKKHVDGASTRSAWLSGLDFAALFPAVERFTKLGFDVLGYGSGQIRVASCRTKVNQLILQALQLGLVPPLSISKLYPLELRADYWGGSKELLLHAMISAEGAHDFLNRLDGLPFLPAHKINMAVEDITYKFATRQGAL